MWAVEKPTFDPGDVFTLCISKIKNADLKQRLQSVRPTIVAAAAEFDQHANVHSLNLIAQSDGINNIVSTEEMVKVYDQRMAGKVGPGRTIYDQLKMLPDGDRCPFCDQRNVSTLDHFLPKVLFPSLTVTPCNLVGACMECNKIKTTFAPQSAEEVWLHPYFDNVTNVTWLTATVIEQDPCGFVYSVTPPAAWNVLTGARAIGQFAALGLGELYASEASRELANIRFNLRHLFQAGGEAAVRDELLRQWRSRRSHRLNSWQTAMYRAISQSDWFCDGGFDA